MASKNIACPRCGETVRRIKRRLIDRIVSYFKPVKRYQCEFCDWEDSIVTGSVKQASKN
jgi:hypothetical protein